MPGESDVGFFGSDSEDQPSPSDEDAVLSSDEPPSYVYDAGYRGTYTASAATSVPLSPWCIIFYVVLPCFALFGLLVSIYYSRCFPWLCCYRDDDENDDEVWRDRSKKVREDSEKTEGTAENKIPPTKPNGIPTSIAIAIPEESAREGLPVAREMSSWRSWLLRSKKSASSIPPSSFL